MAGLRIGCVHYLNSKPLVYGHSESVSFETPASLAAGLDSGRLDAALAPIYALVAQPDLLVVDGVAIASRGPVHSVFIAHAGELSALRTLYLDPASRTSASLQRILLGEFTGIDPRCEVLAAGAPEIEPGEDEGVLLIGDRAIRFRAAHGERYRYLDLGEAWMAATGLPFVFAAWLMRPGIPNAREVADGLRRWRDEGTANIEQIVRGESAFPAEFTRFYLTERIRFHLGAEEKLAMHEYARLLHRHPPPGGLPPGIGEVPRDFQWV